MHHKFYQIYLLKCIIKFNWMENDTLKDSIQPFEVKVSCKTARIKISIKLIYQIINMNILIVNILYNHN